MPEAYTARPMWLAKERTYSIERDGLRIQDAAGAARTIPWHKVSTVRLHWVQAKNQPRSYYCHITLIGDRTPVASFSQLRFQGVLSYVDQSAGYDAFVQTLAARISEAAPSAKFVTGSGPFERLFFSGAVWAAAAGCAALSFTFLSGAWGRIDTGIPLSFAVAAGGLGWLAWKVYHWTAPRPIDPHALPNDVLAGRRN